MNYILAPILFVSVLVAAVMVANGRKSRQDRFWDRDLND